MRLIGFIILLIFLVPTIFLSYYESKIKNEEVLTNQYIQEYNCHLTNREEISFMYAYEHYTCNNDIEITRKINTSEKSSESFLKNNSCRLLKFDGSGNDITDTNSKETFICKNNIKLIRNR
ncbi:Uncharacterised protein [Escherichia coli]|nr:Uncharacterised protein [Escherichia coli]